MAGETLGQALGRVTVLDLPDHKGVIADDQIVRQGHIRLRGSGLLVLKCVPSREAIEGFPSAVERIDLVKALEFLDAEHGHLEFAALEYALRFQKLGKTWRWSARSRKRRLKRRPLLSAQPEALAIRQSLLSTGQSAFQDEFADRAMRSMCGDLQRVLGGRRQPEIKLLVAGFDFGHDGSHYATALRDQDSTGAGQCHDGRTVV
jgi:hypothetical protein